MRSVGTAVAVDFVRIDISVFFGPANSQPGSEGAVLIRTKTGCRPIVGVTGIVRNAESRRRGFGEADNRAVLASCFPRSRNRLVKFCEQLPRRSPDCWVPTNSWGHRNCPQCGVRKREGGNGEVDTLRSIVAGQSFSTKTAGTGLNPVTRNHRHRGIDMGVLEPGPPTWPGWTW